jgi:biopolymer transport protein ExbD
MRFSDRNGDDANINLTPLIDVVFLLLIFFMVSTTFSKEAQLKIQLPQSSDQPSQPQDNLVEIQISAKGVYAVKGPDDDAAKQLVNTTRETLTRALKQATQGRKELVTVIRADRRTPHESVITAMDITRRLGYTNITFATQQSLENTENP